MKKGKKVLAVLLTTATCLAALAGCGNSAPVQTENDSESQETTNVTDQVMSNTDTSAPDRSPGK